MAFLKFTTALLAAASLAAAAPTANTNTNSTAPEPITLGRLGIPHGYLIRGWAPSKTTPLEAACTEALNLQAVHTNYPDHPLCDYGPFEINGRAGLQVKCRPAKDQWEPEYARVTALATDGTDSHACGEVENPEYVSCGAGAGISELYYCLP